MATPVVIQLAQPFQICGRPTFPQQTGLLRADPVKRINRDRGKDVPWGWVNAVRGVAARHRPALVLAGTRGPSPGRGRGETTLSCGAAGSLTQFRHGGWTLAVRLVVPHVRSLRDADAMLRRRHREREGQAARISPPGPSRRKSSAVAQTRSAGPVRPRAPGPCGDPGQRCGRTQTPRPATVRTRPSARSTSKARMTVPTAIPCSWLRVFALGRGVRGGYLPEVIPSLSKSASCW